MTALAWSGRLGASSACTPDGCTATYACSLSESSDPPGDARGRRSSARAAARGTAPTSPNWRSRSTISDRSCRASASATARLVDVSVLPVPPFGPSTQMSDGGVIAPGVDVRAAGERLAHREPQLLLRERERDDVGRPRLERAPEEPVRRAQSEHEDGQARLGPPGAVDHVDRAVGLAATGDEEDVARAAVDATNGRVGVLDDTDELEARVARQRLLDIDRVDADDGDERPDRSLVPRGLLPSRLRVDECEQLLLGDDPLRRVLGVPCRPEQEPQRARVGRERDRLCGSRRAA